MGKRICNALSLVSCAALLIGVALHLIQMIDAFWDRRSAAGELHFAAIVLRLLLIDLLWRWRD